MRRHAIRRAVVMVIIAGTMIVGSGRAQAWYSPVNVWRQSAPPAAPGLLGETYCLIQSMDGNIFGTAFAKAYAVSTFCLTVRAQVVYGSLGLGGTPGPTVGCCNQVSQSSQPSTGVVGGFFWVTTADHSGTILVSTTVFAPSAAAQSPSLLSSAASLGGSPGVDPMAKAFDQAMALARRDAPRPWYAPEVRAQLVHLYAEHRACMLANGIGDYPALPAGFGDGTVAGPVLGGPEGSDLASDSPDLQGAVAACAAQNESLRAATLAANEHAGI